MATSRLSRPCRRENAATGARPTPARWAGLDRSLLASASLATRAPSGRRRDRPAFVPLWGGNPERRRAATSRRLLLADACYWQTPVTGRRSLLARCGRLGGVDALADHILADPAGLDHHAEVLLGDREIGRAHV